jgi:ferric-dicitrate binding protein FerR (iron transport regulator)
MENQEIESLLRKYREGTASEAEKALLESWYLSRDDNSIAELSPQEFSEDLLFIGNGLPLEENVRKLYSWRSVAAVAAALALFFIGYLQWPAIQNRLHPATLTALTVPLGQKQQLTLADGSKVWVNAGSELKYPKTFNGKTREVYLTGEAYFDIQHDAARTFIIHTGKVATTVLGTAFNIREDRSAHTIQVTVTRGKVSVANGDKLLGVITPNQQISFNTLNQATVKQEVDAVQVVAWQKIDLKFEDVTFAEAAQRLEKRFNVKISFANDKLKNCRFTGASLNGDQLEKVLKAICDFNNASYQTRSDGNIIINGPGCTD